MSAVPRTSRMPAMITPRKWTRARQIGVRRLLVGEVAHVDRPARQEHRTLRELTSLGIGHGVEIVGEPVAARVLQVGRDHLVGVQVEPRLTGDLHLVSPVRVLVERVARDRAEERALLEPDVVRVRPACW